MPAGTPRKKVGTAQVRLCLPYNLSFVTDQLRTVMQEMSECRRVRHTASA